MEEGQRVVTVLAGLGKGSCKEGCRAYGKRPASRTVASRREPNRYLIQIPLRLSQQPKRCGTSPQSRSGIDRWYEAAAVRSSRLGRPRCAAAPGACGFRRLPARRVSDTRPRIGWRPPRCSGRSQAVAVSAASDGAIPVAGRRSRHGGDPTTRTTTQRDGGIASLALGAKQSKPDLGELPCRTGRSCAPRWARADHPASGDGRVIGDGS